MGKHYCDPNGKPTPSVDRPPYADPGQPVQVKGTDVCGRVRLAWTCCGTVVVEHMADPDDPDCSETVSVRYLVSEVEPIPWGVSYSVPCVGAAWSLDLPCGHLAGEGCDCDTIAAEADSV